MRFASQRVTTFGIEPGFAGINRFPEQLSVQLAIERVAADQQLPNSAHMRPQRIQILGPAATKAAHRTIVRNDSHAAEEICTSRIFVAAAAAVRFSACWPSAPLWRTAGPAIAPLTAQRNIRRLIPYALRLPLSMVCSLELNLLWLAIITQEKAAMLERYL